MRERDSKPAMSLYDSLGEGGEGGGGAAATSELAAAGASKPGGPPLHRRVLDGEPCLDSQRPAMQ